MEPKKWRNRCDGREISLCLPLFPVLRVLPREEEKNLRKNPAATRHTGDAGGSQELPHPAIIHRRREFGVWERCQEGPVHAPCDTRTDRSVKKKRRTEMLPLTSSNVGRILSKGEFSCGFYQEFLLIAPVEKQTAIRASWL